MAGHCAGLRFGGARGHQGRQARDATVQHACVSGRARMTAALAPYRLGQAGGQERRSSARGGWQQARAASSLRRARAQLRPGDRAAQGVDTRGRQPTGAGPAGGAPLGRRGNNEARAPCPRRSSRARRDRAASGVRARVHGRLATTSPSAAACALARPRDAPSPPHSRRPASRWAAQAGCCQLHSLGRTLGTDRRCWKV